MKKDGSIVTGWIKHDGNDYLLYSSGIMTCSTEAYGYKFESNGVAVKRYF